MSAPAQLKLKYWEDQRATILPRCGVSVVIVGMLLRPKVSGYLPSRVGVANPSSELASSLARQRLSFNRIYYPRFESPVARVANLKNIV